MLKQVFIVRHGETDYNVAHRWQGQLQTPLNQVGRDQAAALRDSLQKIPFETVYSSDLIRASETAKIIAKPHNLHAQEITGLREIALGVFEGHTRAEIKAAHPDWIDQWDAEETFAPPGGESRRMLQERAYAAWQSILEQNTSETILVVTHGGTLRMLLAKVLDDDALKHESFGNTSLTVLKQTAETRWQVIRLNDTAHLQE